MTDTFDHATPHADMHVLPGAGTENPFAEQVERRVRQIEAHVRARPIMIVGLAALGGFILGRMLRD